MDDVSPLPPEIKQKYLRYKRCPLTLVVIVLWSWTHHIAPVHSRTDDT